jgi:hypothetical protein
MSRRTVFWYVGLLLLIAVLYIGWVFWVGIGYFQPVIWCKQECALQLSYIPASHGSANLIVDEDYVEGTAEPWILASPGATKRWLGAPDMPSLEELEANARVPLSASSPRGLCKLYQEVGEAQREDIIYDLKDRSGDSSELRKELQQLYETGAYPWLEEVLPE